MPSPEDDETDANDGAGAPASPPNPSDSTDTSPPTQALGVDEGSPGRDGDGSSSGVSGGTEIESTAESVRQLLEGSTNPITETSRSGKYDDFQGEETDLTSKSESKSSSKSSDKSEENNAKKDWSEYQEAVEVESEWMHGEGGKAYEWMTEQRNASMFKEIEGRLQGVLGKGLYDWVDRRVFDQVFDQSTLMALHKLMKNKEIDTVDFPIARGKEAHVFHATSDTGPVAVKIFHTSNAVFKSLNRYIDGDPRFSGLRRKHRLVVTIWVRKEYRNLLRMKKHGLRVPTPRALLKNVLIMDYIGDSTGPAPRLRDAEIPDPAAVFEEMLEFLRVCWQKAKLAHADFSEYNILWHEGEPWVIDAGQAVTDQHPAADEFLVRDVTRLVQWAGRNGIEYELADAMANILYE
jgi:RIO kinase 1